jgi:SAM-dependent methyltransferase
MADLGFQPPSNSLLTNLEEPETHYPLTAYVCEKCWLAQVPESKKATEIFTEDYPYFSSQSPANVSHAKKYVDMICERFKLGERQWDGILGVHKCFKKTKVLEIGSNDGYMLQFFKERACEVLGIDPAMEPAKVAIGKGIPTEITFFQYYMHSSSPTWDTKFDLICGINVLAHQPDINDFVKGLKMVLAPEGIITFEFPHLMRTIEGMQFDQIYAEHFSYFSFVTVREIFRKHGLEIFDVDYLREHGGSLRIYAQHDAGIQTEAPEVRELIGFERDAGMFTAEYYTDFNKKVQIIKDDFMEWLYNSRSLGETTIAYGAAAKGNTFLNYCGIRSDLIPCVIDKSPHKQGKYLPGSHIKIVSEEEGMKLRPDYVLILPWNLEKEISEQLKYISEWGGKTISAMTGWRF